MNLEFPSVIDFGLERAAEVLNRAFADYLVRIPFSLPMLLNLSRADSVDLSVSCVFLRDGEAIGAALVARRGWTCRLAAMAVVPAQRRSGLGRAAVAHLLNEAEQRGDRAMVLEVIEQNIAAVELYRACGFDTIRRLIGFSGVASDVLIQKDFDAAAQLTEVDLREVGAAVIRYGLPDLPWQLSGETIAQLPPPAIGYRLNDAWIAITDPTQPVVAVRALVGRDSVEPNVLLRTVMAKYPRTTEWRFHPVWPEELARLIESVGLPRTALSQFQMQRKIGDLSR